MLPKGNYIGHNKFVVYVDSNGVPRTVPTGTTNWTATGLCAQSNNAIIVDDNNIAKRYYDYWKFVLKDNAKQAPPFRNEDAVTSPYTTLRANAGSVRVWFSLNTKNRQKPKSHKHHLTWKNYLSVLKRPKMESLWAHCYIKSLRI